VSATSVTARGRVAAEANMLDACTVRRVTNTSDPDTGAATPSYTAVYTGKCKVQQRAPAAAPTDVGEAAVFVGQLELHVPTSVTGPQPDDLVTVTACALDPDLVGRTFRLRGPSHKSFLTARRFPMAEVSG
jgi:Family of unknown function (DUF6093)